MCVCVCVSMCEPCLLDSLNMHFWNYFSSVLCVISQQVPLKQATRQLIGSTAFYESQPTLADLPPSLTHFFPAFSLFPHTLTVNHPLTSAFIISPYPPPQPVSHPNIHPLSLFSYLIDEG